MTELSLSNIKPIEPIDHRAYQPLSLSTIEPIDNWAYWLLSLLTIEPIDHWAYRPSSLSTIKPIDHRAYRPSSLLTIKPIDLWSSFATFKPFGLLPYHRTLVSFISIFSASSLSNYKIRDSFGKLKTCRFQNCPWFWNLKIVSDFYY